MYDSINVAEKIRALAKNKKVSLKQLLIDAGLGSNTMSNMKSSMPKSDNLAIIADLLDCSVDYLLGRSNVVAIPDSIKLSEEESEIFSIFRDMNLEGQEKILAYARDLNSTGQYKKASSVGLVEEKV